MIPYEFNAERFSRWMAYVLRHNPSRYGLQPDQHGYVDFEAFLAIARQRYPDLTPGQLRDLIASGGSDRFEVTDTRLRARYGHSIPVEPSTQPVIPPPRLYYGMDAIRVAFILREGLKPSERQMLHLSEYAEDAWAIIQRKTSQPALLAVDAKRAHEEGVSFYREGKVYLAGPIGPAYLSIAPQPASRR